MPEDHDARHQNLSAIIAGCGVYNWAANCDAIPIELQLLQPACSFSWTDHTKYEPGSNSTRSHVGSFRDFSSFDRFLTSFAASSLTPTTTISPPLLHIPFPATASHSLQHSPVMWTHCCLFIACKPSSPHCLRHALMGIVPLPTCGSI